MIKRYVFRAPDAAPTLQSRLQARSADDVAVEISAANLKVWRRHAVPLLNGFSPVFVGRIEQRDAGCELAGRFRFHLFAIGVIAGFLGLSVYHLLHLALGQVPAGYPPQWRTERIQFELQFLGFSAVAIYVAWLAGRPMRERILELIRSALEPQKPGKRRQ